MIITRFAPSPTGELHIGGLRTAIFNWLFARATNGQFKLRIEDTDVNRSTNESIDTILDSMSYMNLDYDDLQFQSNNKNRHVDVVNTLLSNGFAYEEITDSGTIVRLKIPKENTNFNDIIRGNVIVTSDNIHDVVLLKSDGNPTFVISCAVDDYDMGVTHVIRGDDHITNTLHQVIIYDAMGWDRPIYCHIPLIHDENGKKLSKRHGASGLQYYIDKGMTAEGVFSYLLNLGWGYKNEENISKENAIKWFDIKDINKNPARLDMKKMEKVNYNIMKSLSYNDLLYYLPELKDVDKKEVLIDSLRTMAKTILDYKKFSNFVFSDDVDYDMDITYLSDIIYIIENNDIDDLFSKFKELAEENGVKVNDIIKPLRLILCNSEITPSIHSVIDVLGKHETIRRLKNFIDINE